MFPPVPAYLPPPGGAGLRNNAVNASIACKITPFNVMYTVNNIRYTIIVYRKNVQLLHISIYRNLSQFVERTKTHKIVTLKPSSVRYRYFPGGCPPWTPARHASSSCAAGCTATILHAQYFLPVGCSRLRRHQHSILYLPAAAGHRRALQQGKRCLTVCRPTDLQHASPHRTSSAGFQMEPVKTIDGLGAVAADPVRGDFIASAAYTCPYSMLPRRAHNPGKKISR